MLAARWEGERKEPEERFQIKRTAQKEVRLQPQRFIPERIKWREKKGEELRHEASAKKKQSRDAYNAKREKRRKYLNGISVSSGRGKSLRGKEGESDEAQTQPS